MQAKLTANLKKGVNDSKSEKVALLSFILLYFSNHRLTRMENGENFFQSEFPISSREYPMIKERKTCLNIGTSLLDIQFYNCHYFRLPEINSSSNSTSSFEPRNNGTRWCISFGCTSRIRCVPVVAFPPACSTINAIGFAS